MGARGDFVMQVVAQVVPVFPGDCAGVSALLAIAEGIVAVFVDGAAASGAWEEVVDDGEAKVTTEVHPEVVAAYGVVAGDGVKSGRDSCGCKAVAAACALGAVAGV